MEFDDLGLFEEAEELLTTAEATIRDGRFERYQAECLAHSAPPRCSRIDHVAGRIIEVVTGRTYEQAVKEMLLDPLGLDNTSFLPRLALRRRLADGMMWTYDGRTFEAPVFEPGMMPAANLYSTVTDLGRFISALFAVMLLVLEGKLGRVSLTYQSIGGENTGGWDPSSGNWVALPPETYQNQIAAGLRVARKQVAPDLITVPVPAPTSGGQ